MEASPHSNVPKSKNINATCNMSGEYAGRGIINFVGYRGQHFHFWINGVPNFNFLLLMPGI
jgi:hypothetical protein